MKKFKGLLLGLAVWGATFGLVPAPSFATISQPTATVTDSGNGSTTVFNYGFIIPYQANGSTPAVKVTVVDPTGNETVLTGGQFSITGINNPLGGTVTYPLSGSPLASGYFLVIARNLAYIQPTAVSNYNFYPHTVEQVADNLDMQIQQLAIGSGGGGGTVTNPITLTGIGGDQWQVQVDPAGNLNLKRISGSGYVNVGQGAPVFAPGVSSGASYANDTTAAGGGILVGQLYRNGSVTQVRVH